MLILLYKKSLTLTLKNRRFPAGDYFFQLEQKPSYIYRHKPLWHFVPYALYSSHKQTQEYIVQTVNQEIGVFFQVKRPTGEIEMVDVTKRCPFNQQTLNRAYEDTKKAGRGEILKMINRRMNSNLGKLMRQYNNVMNEGGEGYMPDQEYFKNHKDYREFVEELVLQPN